MELVLSPGEAGGEGTGGPFRNEDVREWSRVDRITGMLERARVETGRWRANTKDATHSYGKMIDSRERNSADGSLVQKARRQVEVFQSQGNGGRSFQVVRASQWASSRAIDSAFELGPHNNKSNLSGGELVGNGLSPRLSSLMWRASLNEQASDLEKLSSICRQLHEEAMSQHSRLWDEALPLAGPEATGIAQERRSNSSEDLSSLADSFARDCRTRRSLQIGEDEAKSRRAEPANGFSIAENNFVKNDPKHPSKISHAKVSVQDTGVAATQNGHAPSPAVARKTNNKTVVHLRNAASPTADAERRVNLMKLDNEPIETNGMDEQPQQPNGAKPVKRVEFCKTEIHFAPDSGKVNIVETDGKPPPTNKFRRRRRRDSIGAVANANAQKSNMPLVHFGDTSYEKYIFGGQAKPSLAERKKNGTDNTTTEENGFGPNEPEKKERWDAGAAPPAERKIIREDSIVAAPGKEPPPADANLERPDTHKSRGTHTTTVNFLSDEALRKQQPAPPGEGRIQVSFAASTRSLSPLLGDDEEASCVVSRTTKITLHLPPAAISPRLLPASPFSNLKSVRLVMSIEASRDCSASLDQLFSRLYRPDSPQLWSLQLATPESSGPRDHLPMLMDKAAYPSNNGVTRKDIGIQSDPPAETAEPSPDQVQVKIAAGTGELQPSLDEPDAQTKDPCDSASQTNEQSPRDPTYENIFDASTSSGAPLYENFHVVAASSQPKAEPRKRPSKPSSSHDRRPQLPSSKLGTSRSTASATKSDKTPQPHSPLAKRCPDKLGSRDASVKRFKDITDTKIVEDGNARNRIVPKADLAAHRSHKAPANNSTDKSSARSKKPVEVVYQTAVYNMKNEKLSKPTRGSKGPRLINDLICGGSKIKRPADKKVAKNSHHVTKYKQEKRNAHRDEQIMIYNWQQYVPSV